MDNNLTPAARKANLLFKKQERAREGIEGWAEYSAREAATLRKTARLRELRLANESKELPLAFEANGSKNRKAPSKSR